MKTDTRHTPTAAVITMNLILGFLLACLMSLLCGFTIRAFWFFATCGWRIAGDIFVH